MKKNTTKNPNDSKNLHAADRDQRQEVKPIYLQHTIKLSRQEFDEGIGKVALILLDKGKLDLKSTENVQKYIFEFDVTD